MRQLVKVFRSRRGRIVSAILAAGQSDKDLIAAFRDRFLWPRRREAYATLERGIRRGELRKDMIEICSSILCTDPSTCVF